MVYISTFNSSHAIWAEKAILKGFHVIVDKPAFTSLQEAKRVVSLAAKLGKCLAESTVYACHPQVQSVKGIFSSVKRPFYYLRGFFSSLFEHHKASICSPLLKFLVKKKEKASFLNKKEKVDMTMIDAF